MVIESPQSLVLKVSILAKRGLLLKFGGSSHAPLKKQKRVENVLGGGKIKGEFYELPWNLKKGGKSELLFA